MGGSRYCHSLPIHLKGSPIKMFGKQWCMKMNPLKSRTILAEIILTFLLPQPILMMGLPLLS
jgi:hypothetical protein